MLHSLLLEGLAYLKTLLLFFLLLLDLIELLLCDILASERHTAVLLLFLHYLSHEVDMLHL